MTPNVFPRRVSFNERVYYSDDLTETDDSQVSTPSTSTSVDEISDIESVECEEELLSDAEANKDEDGGIIVKQETFIKTSSVSEAAEKNSRRGESENFKAWTPPVVVKDEEPLMFRDRGVYQRPQAFLGGYGSEAYTPPPHRVKLRKSWVATSSSNPVRPDSGEFHEFEEWKRTRVTQSEALEFKVTKPTGETDDQALSIAEGTSTEKEAVEKTRCGQTFNPKRAEDANVRKLSSCSSETALMGSLRKTDIINPRETKASRVACKETAKMTSEKKKGKGEEKEKEIENKMRVTVTATSNKSALLSTTAGTTDKELEAYQKEILGLKEDIASLERKLQVVEVRHVSQLADLEEDTAQKMRAYRDWADDVTRKQRAKEEKQRLKEKAMTSQDVIDKLRRSNQKLRSDGLKLLKSVEKLRASNQVLEEKNSFQADYSVQFLEFQKTEVSLAKSMNMTLAADMPKYERVVKGMKEGVTDRERCGHIERRAKELYEDCIHSLIAIVDEQCTDPALLNKVTAMVEEYMAPTDEQEFQCSSNTSSRSSDWTADKMIEPGRKPISIQQAKKRFVSSTKKAISRTPRSEKQKADGVSGLIRRRSGNKKLESVQRHPRKSPSFHGTRSSNSGSMGRVEDEDSSSTCSVTSAQSDNSFSPSTYTFGDY